MVVVLIPAYKPDACLLALLKELMTQGLYAGFVLVDDGGGEAYRPIFDQAVQMGAHVVAHAVNLGKGRALKTGLNACLLHFPGADVITADCDGQHKPKDIAHLAQRLKERSQGATVVLGKRVLSKRAVPWRSRAGNAVMRVAFYLSTGTWVYDTQTGLRGIPHQLIKPCLSIPGERYEYEMNVLLNLPREGVRFEEVEIETVYIAGNASSHFHPVRDALRVFARLFAFAASSLSCYAVDYTVYALLIEAARVAPGLAYVCARAVSSILNFTINRTLVFKAKGQPLLRHLIGYYALVLLVMGLGYLGVRAGTGLGLNSYICKLVVDTLLYAVSFTGQRLVVFKPKARRGEGGI